MGEIIYIHNSWQRELADEFSKPYFITLQERLDNEYRNYTINPDREHIFGALELTPFEDVKVVIVGQDPTPVAGQASGVAFSVPYGDAIPASTLQIFELLRRDLGYEPVPHGCLESWANQGVLLLNSFLTVRQGQARSHAGIGWENFTDAIVRKLNAKDRPVVFILWGSDAQQKRRLISENHLIITAHHPAAILYEENDDDFLTSRPFSQTNQFLEANGIQPIDWRLPQAEPRREDENIAGAVAAIGMQ